MSKGDKAKKTRMDWARTAAFMWAREGIAGVRVERIARELGVTKGSFYWHFEDREALLRAVLEIWEQEGTHKTIQALEQGERSAREKLERLWELASDPQHLRIEVAFHEAARVSGFEWIAEVVDRVDQQRADYLCRVFEELGHPAKEAQARAFLFFSLLFGDYMLGVKHKKRGRARVLEQARVLLYELAT